MTEPWPPWPRLGHYGRELIAEVADSQVWTISGRSRGRPLQCELFREEFAEFLGRRWCVEVDHGSSALVAAFSALGIGPGDEVIVPALTWVACATSVLRVGARPVLVDVDPHTLCLAAHAVDAAVTANTRAVLVVHLHCTAADVESLAGVARRRGLHLVEDCAQAHGARWSDGRMVGSDGVLATFSMQQSKVLTAGEGGAVAGDDDPLRRRVECARADGRELCGEPPPAGEMLLEETGLMTGANLCLGEFAAAILRDGLRRLADEVDRRAASADLLDRLLADRGVRVIARHPGLATRPVYEYGIHLDRDVFGDGPPEAIRRALARALGLPVYAPDAPLHLSPLFQPETNPHFGRPRQAFFAPGARFEVAERAFERLAMIHHAAFLAEPDRMTEIARACERVIAGRRDVA